MIRKFTIYPKSRFFLVFRIDSWQNPIEGVWRPGFQTIMFFPTGLLHFPRFIERRIAKRKAKMENVVLMLILKMNKLI